MGKTEQQMSLYSYVQDSLAPPIQTKQKKSHRNVEETTAAVAPRKRRASKKKEEIPVLPQVAIDYLEAASRLEACFAKPSHERPHDYGIVLSGLCREKREADNRVKATNGGENPYKKYENGGLEYV